MIGRRKQVNDSIVKLLKMLKYVDAKVTFSEVPDRISLCISFSNCAYRCKGCHSSYLWEDIGIPFTIDTLKDLIEANKGIDCVCFMGGDNNIPQLIELEKWVKSNTSLYTCWYTGAVMSVHTIDRPSLEYLDYIKTGPYIESLGGLTSPHTNQRFHAKGKVLNKMDASPNMWYDITYKFRTNENTNN